MLDIVTLATVPAVLAMVNLGKQFGITGKWATLAAVLLGITFQCIDYISTYAPALENLQAGYLIREASHGLLLGLAAAGLYDLTPTRNTTAGRGKHAL